MYFDFHPMLKRCIFTITDKDTGEIYGQFDKTYQLDVVSQRDLVKKILARFVEIPYEKQCNIVATFTCRPAADTVKPADLF